MKLSPDTRRVLANFANINTNIVVTPGSSLKTISPTKTVMATATVGENFDNEFVIYDLGNFLSILGMFSDPEIEFDTNHMLVGNGNDQVQYFFANKDVLVYPQKDVKLPAVFAKFEVSKDVFDQIVKTASILRTQDVTFQSDGETVVAVVHDKKDKSSNKRKISLGKNDSGKEFVVNFSIENLAMLPSDYTVNLCSGVSYWSTKINNTTVEYWVACEADSTSK